MVGAIVRGTNLGTEDGLTMERASVYKDRRDLPVMSTISGIYRKINGIRRCGIDGPIGMFR
jgi:hypothetical protein